MSTPIRPQYLNDPVLRRLVELERQVALLSQRASLRNAAMVNGTIRILDDSGTVRTVLGRLDNGDFGIEAYNAAGILVFAVRDSGLVRPASVLDTFDSFTLAPPRSITSGSFGNYFSSRAPVTLADGLVLSINVGSDVGTTGELQVQIIAASGNVTSSAYSIPSGLGGGGGGTGPRTLKWAHGLVLGENDLTLSVQVQLRRTGGGGNIYAVNPSLVTFVDAVEFGCTGMGGNWS
jgi:hypothetical protein